MLSNIHPSLNMGTIFASELPTLPNEIIQKIFIDITYKDLLKYTTLNDYWYQAINNKSFKETRYKTNPKAKDSQTDLHTTRMIQHLIKKRNCLDIELNSAYSDLYQQFGITKEEFCLRYQCNKERISYGMNDFYKLRIKYHSIEPQFIISVNDGYYSDRGIKITDDSLYHALFRILFFKDICYYLVVDC